MHGRRLFLSLIAAVSLAAQAAWSAEIGSVPELHPLLLGPVAEATSPLALSLSAQTAALAPLMASPERIPAELAAMASKGPVESAAAAVLARALSDRQAAQRLGELQPKAQLAVMPELSAQGKAALAQIERAHKGFVEGVFDGSAPSLDLDDVRIKSGSKPKVRDHGVVVAPLGQGAFGVVYPHPKAEGAVLKVVEHSFEITLFGNQTQAETFNKERATAKALAAADVGPRYLGGAVHDRRLVSARERVYGDTIDRLIHQRRFTEEERALVLDLIGRMAKAGVKVDDMRPENVMIGTTKLDQRRRAYVVDGGSVLEPAGKTEEERAAELWNQHIVLMGRFDPHVGWVESTRRFSTIIDDGVARSKDKTFWQKLKRTLRDIMRSPMIPPAR